MITVEHRVYKLTPEELLRSLGILPGEIRHVSMNPVTRMIEIHVCPPDRTSGG